MQQCDNDGKAIKQLEQVVRNVVSTINLHSIEIFVAEYSYNYNKKDSLVLYN